MDCLIYSYAALLNRMLGVLFVNRYAAWASGYSVLTAFCETKEINTDCNEIEEVGLPYLHSELVQICIE